MNLKEKNIVIIGLGKSGKEVALFAARHGAFVVVNDSRKTEAFTDTKKELGIYNNISFILGSQGKDLIDSTTELVIKSPGVPPTIPPLKEAHRRGIPVYTEVELAYLFTKAAIIGITGTNGKTTTTSLTAEILKKAGKNVLLGGNIGTPLLSLVEKSEEGDYLVAELSSFQLDNINKFRPHISAILNITEDHMDYHGSLEAYINAKANILKNQREDDYAVFNADDEIVKSLAKTSKAKKVFFSRKQELFQGVLVKEGNIIIREGNKDSIIMGCEEISLPGLHNLENSLAAVAVAHCTGVPGDIIAEVLKNFKGVEHRLESVREIEGIKFVNDSKGTNVEAAVKALESYREPIVLIAGGLDRGSSFADLISNIKTRARFLILLGEAKERMAAACRKEGYTNYFIVDTLPEAVTKAYEKAKQGDVVLLSPACPSWDMFKNFEERGNLFKSSVASLGGKVNEEKTGEKRI